MTFHWHNLGQTSCHPIIVLGFAIFLSSCTIGHNSQPYLPSRDNIVAGETITVKNNENIYGVARSHNASMREIIVLNNLHPPFALKGGQKLILPAGAGGIAMGGATGRTTGGLNEPTPNAAMAGAVEKVELAPISSNTVTQSSATQAPSNYTSSLNYKNNAVTSAPLTTGAVRSGPVEALNAPSPALKQVATTVKPTVNAEIASANPEPLVPVAQSNISQSNIVSVSPTTSVASTPSITPAASASSVAKPSPALAATPATTEIPPMHWPLQGPLLSSFGDKGQGLMNDGVNIGAPKGSPVVAAAGGTVVYAGNEMKGFGNLVLIRHEKGWVTAYAHLDRMLVAKDTIVAQGDMIGTVGKTGNVPSPQLHFEARHEGKPVDPKGIIKS